MGSAVGSYQILPPDQKKQDGGYQIIPPSAKPPEQPGFVARTSEALGLTQHPLDQLESEYQQFKAHPLDTSIRTVSQAATGVRDLANKVSPVSVDESGSFHLNNPLTGLRDAVGGQRFAQDVQNKNYGGAAGTLVGDALPFVAPSAANAGLSVTRPIAASTAERSITNLIRPTSGDVVFGKNPARGILNQEGGSFALSKERLLDRVNENIPKVGSDIDKVVDAAPQTPKDITNSIHGPINAAFNDAAQRGESALIGRLQDARRPMLENLSFDPASGQIVSNGPRNLAAATPRDILDLKRNIGGSTKWTNQAFDNEVNATRGGVYGNLAGDLNESVPEVAPLNQQYGDLLSAGNALKRRIAVSQRNNPVSLGDLVVGSGPGGLAAVAAKKGIAATPFRTGAADLLWGLSKTPDFGIAPTNSLIASLGSKTTKKAQSEDEP